MFAMPKFEREKGKRAVAAAAAAALLAAFAAMPAAWAGANGYASTASAAACASQALPDQASEYAARWTSLHMGTVISAQVFADSPERASELGRLIEEEIVRYDDMMSVHKATALNEVNRRAGQWVAVTPEIAEMTREAVRVAELTEGAFEPTIGPLVNLWKIGFGGNSVPSAEKIQAALKRVDYRRIEVKDVDGQWFVRIGQDQNIDMGAIAKGYIGQKLVEKLREAGATRALLDLGGNIALLGEKREDVPWRVGLQRPDQQRGTYFAIVSAADVNVITSGAYERNFEKNGKRYGHILSAKTGMPVNAGLSSVTIVDKNGARGDALCTALFGMGEAEAEAFLRANPDVHAVLLSSDLKTVVMSRALQEIVDIADPALRVKMI